MNSDARQGRKRGRRLRLSLQRRWIGDLLAVANATPAAAAERIVRVGPAMLARRAIADPPGWTAILLKAYAIVAARRPELRRVYLSFPWPHLYEHPHSVASVVSEREWRGELGVFFDQIIAPETKPLVEIDRIINHLARARIESIGGYRRLIRFAKLPRPVRRIVWWICQRTLGGAHARYFGTFAMNALVVRYTGVAQTMTPITMAMTHLPLEPPGRIRLYGVFDHRVFDGMMACRVLGEVETVVNQEIVAELRSLARPPGIDAVDGATPGPASREAP